jgi:hypothetical protein
MRMARQFDPLCVHFLRLILIFTTRCFILIGPSSPELISGAGNGGRDILPLN